MKKIDELINLPSADKRKPPGATGSADKPKGPTMNPMETSLRDSSATSRDDIVTRLWTRMTAIYGHKWSSAYGLVGESGYETWTAGLGDLTPAQIRHGVGVCVQRPDPWPPSLPEFRALCRKKSTDIGHVLNVGAYCIRPSTLALPRSKPDYNKARPFIQALRDKTGYRHSDPATTEQEKFVSDAEARKRIQAELERVMHQTTEPQA